MAEIQEIISKEAISGIEKADKGITKLDEDVIKFNKTIDALLADLKKGGVSFSQLQTASKKTTESTKKLTEEQKKLANIEKQVKNNTDRVIKARIEASRKTQEQKQRINELVQAEKGELGTLQKLQNANKKLAKERKTLNLETKKGQDRLKAINSQLDKNNAKIKQSSDNLTKQKINIGNYGSALSGLSPRLAAATTGIQTFGKSLLKLLANPIVAIVAGIVAVFAALVAVFKSTDDGGTKLEALFKGLGAILDVLKRRAVILIDAFAALFSGDFQKAGELFTDTVSGMGDELERATTAAYDFVYAMDALNDRRIAFISEEAKARKEIEEYVALSKDQTKSDQDRLDSLQKAVDLELGLSKKKKEFAKVELEESLKNQAAKANINAAELRAFISLNEEEQTALRKGNKRLADAWNVLGDEVIKELETLYANVEIADADYFRRSQRLTAQLSGFKKKIEKENTDNAIEQKQREVTEFKKLESIKAELLKIDSDTTLESDPYSSQLNSRVIALQNFYATEDELRKDSYKKQISDLEDLYLKKEITLEEFAAKKKEIEQQQESENIAIAQAGITALSSIGDAYFNQQKSQLTALSAQYAKDKEHELAMAGDNQQKINQINQKFAKKEAELKTKQAKADKQSAIFKAVINIAQSITAMLSAGIPGIILAGVAAAIGAVQLATIASQPIPQFYKGTDSAPSGLISVAERGRELIQDKHGRMMLADKPTLASGLGGSKIYTNEETERILNASKTSNTRLDITELKQEQQRTNELLGNLAVSHKGKLIKLNKNKTIISV